MKPSKIDFRIKTATFFFLFIVSLTACDVLEMDPDANIRADAIGVENRNVYVMANNTAFIDLKSRIRATKPIQLSLTATTRYGELVDLGDGFLQYSPSVGNTKAMDSFVFNVLSESNEVIKVDTITIIIRNALADLPCGIYPANDYIHDVKKGTPVSINVLANDNICGIDPKHLIVSILHPDNTFPPSHGAASVNGQNILYTPISTFTGSDKLIYKVHPSFDPNRAAYGIVYFTGEQACTFSLTNDLFAFSKDSISGTLELPAFSNDSLCSALYKYQVRISQSPQFGTASVTATGFKYQVSATTTVTSTFTDSFIYEVCIDSSCKTAKVDLKVKPEGG